MAEVVSPVTKQVKKENREIGSTSVPIPLDEVADCLLYDQHGVSFPFKELYQDRKSVIIFVRVWEKVFALILLMSHRLSHLKLRL